MNYYGARELAESFRTVRKNTIQVAEDIPEDKYGFKAAEGCMTVAAMLSHLASSTHWAQQVHCVEKKTDVTMEDFGRYMAEMTTAQAALTTKAAIVEALKANGEAFAKQLESMAEAQLAEVVTFPGGGKTRFEQLLGVKEHEMHHRGQLMQVERMIGVVPHLTRARQQRQQ